MNLFQLGDFTLNSGAKSTWKIECDALTVADWEALAQMVHQMIGPFCSVEGVPTGGLMLADALKPFVGSYGPCLIVDDVLTTGRSLEKVKATYHQPKVVGAVIFARGKCPYWVKPLFQMPECLWIKNKEKG